MSNEGDIYWNQSPCCVLCGVRISSYSPWELKKAHEGWDAWSARKVNTYKSLTVPAAELEYLEDLDPGRHSPICSSFYRASEWPLPFSCSSRPSTSHPVVSLVLDDAKTGHLSISGISPNLMHCTGKKDHVVVQPDKAMVIPARRILPQ